MRLPRLLETCVRCSVSLPGWRTCPKGEGHAGPDLSQPALQHLAQDAGAVAREGRRAGGCRIPEDALYGGAAEDAARPVEAAGKGDTAGKTGGRNRESARANIRGPRD